MKPQTILAGTWLMCLLTISTVKAQSIDTLFTAVPMSELPLLERNARLDMLDLYNYKMAAKGENIFGGTSTMTKKSAHHIAVDLTESSRWEMMRLCSGTDTIYACLHTTYCPAGETKASFYHTDWTPADDIALPAFTLDDFWTGNSKIASERQEELRRKLTPLYVEARWEETEGTTPRIAFEVSTATLDCDSQQEAKKCLKTLYRTITPVQKSTTAGTD